jgi:hypothetical protein
MVGLEEVVTSLLSGRNVAQCNQFLQDYTESIEAWETSMSLMKSENLGVSYFSINMVYTKIRRHWNQLNALQRDNVFNFLVECLLSLRYCSSKVFLDIFIALPHY